MKDSTKKKQAKIPTIEKAKMMLLIKKRKKDMEIEEIIEQMKIIEPRYDLWTSEEMKGQIEAIFECDYEWVGSQFKNKETGLYLNVPGLNTYTAEGIKITYESIWSKQNIEGVNKREEEIMENIEEELFRRDVLKKQKKLGVYFLISFSLYFFYDYRFALAVQILILLGFVYGIKILTKK